MCNIKIDPDYSCTSLYIQDGVGNWQAEDGEFFENLSMGLVKEICLMENLFDYHVEMGLCNNKVDCVDFSVWCEDLAKSLSQELPGDFDVYYRQSPYKLIKVE